MGNCDHVRIYGEGCRYRMECEHCGAVYQQGLPVALDMMAAVMNAFLKLHEGCERKALTPSPSPVSERGEIRERIEDDDNGDD